MINHHCIDLKALFLFFGVLATMLQTYFHVVLNFRLIDTAGIRKRAAVASAGNMQEALSVNQAFHAIRLSDVIAFVIKTMACIMEQDWKIAERIEREGKGCEIVVNKWDTIPDKNQQTATYFQQHVREKLRLLKWAPIVYSTAIAGHSVDKYVLA